MAMTPELIKAYGDYGVMRDHLGGCTDGGCIIKKPKGMHTNGGCKCSADKMKMQRMMYAANKLFDAVRDDIAKGIQ